MNAEVLSRPHNGEMAMVKGCDHVGVVPLPGHDDGGIHDPERKLEVLLGQFCHPLPFRVHVTYRRKMRCPGRHRTVRPQSSMAKASQDSSAVSRAAWASARSWPRVAMSL